MLATKDMLNETIHYLYDDVIQYEMAGGIRTYYSLYGETLFILGDSICTSAFRMGKLKNISKLTEKTGITQAHLDIDFYYHWFYNFSFLASYDQLKERLKIHAEAAAPATVIALNKYIKLHHLSDIDVRNLLTGSPLRWIKTEKKEWFPKTYYELQENQFSEYTREAGQENSPFINFQMHATRSAFVVIDSLFPDNEEIDDLDDEDDEENIENTGEILHSYNTRATNHFSFKFKKEEKNPLFMGIELELEHHTTQETATLKSLSNHAICKRDGSLSRGVEICTAPATLSIHKEEFAKFFIAHKENKSKLRAEDTCGLHIHIDKRKMTSLHIALLYKFINDTTNDAEIKKIAGREPNRFCEKHTVDYSYFTQGMAPSKYRQVNLSPPETLELRMFASTTKEKEFFSRIEFAQALYYYTKPGTMPLSVKEVLKWAHFKNYVQSNKKTYPNLASEV